MIKESIFNNVEYRNFDFILLLIIPICIIFFILLSIHNTIYIYYIGILGSIFLYQLIVYDRRNIYGFSGLKYLSIPSLVYVSYIVLIALPSLHIFLNHKSYLLTYFIIVTQFFYIFPLGLIISDKVHSIHYNFVPDIISSDISHSRFDKNLNFILMNLLILSASIFLLYIFRVNKIPLFEMFNNLGESTVLWMLREDAMKLLNVSILERYVFLWQRSLIIPMGLILSLASYKLYKKKMYAYLSIIFFVAGIVFNSLTLEKSPTAALFLIIICFIYLINKKLNIKLLLSGFLLVFSFPFIVYYYYYFGNDQIFIYILQGIINRIFFIPTDVLYEYVTIFPDFHNFLYGRATQLLSIFNQDGGFPLANYVAQVAWGDKFTSGSANVIYVGNFWAEFGFIGTVVATFFIGYITHWFYSIILNASDYKKNWIYLSSICISVPLFTFGFISSNFTTLFFTKGLLILVVLLYFINHINKSSLYDIQ